MHSYTIATHIKKGLQKEVKTYPALELQEYIYRGKNIEFDSHYSKAHLRCSQIP